MSYLIYSIWGLNEIILIFSSKIYLSFLNNKIFVEFDWKTEINFKLLNLFYQFQNSSRMNGISDKLCKSWHFHIPETVFCLLAFTLPELCFALFGPHHKQRSTPLPPTSLSLSAPLLTFSAVFASFFHTLTTRMQSMRMTDG